MERMIVQHLHTEKSGRKPLPEDIMYGELAINYAANGETLFIKNSESAITEFKDDKYYQKQLSEKTDKTLSLTYSELVSLRDNSQLIPGQQYRITDYTCTTTQGNTQSAGHPFDIIVKADSENKLNEEAYAIQHEGDTYFTNSNLSAWKIWYCLDNDTARFAWADATNGKGVIYRMIDEFGNDCPYDFKNIQFARWEMSNPIGYRDVNFEGNYVEESTPFDSLKTGFYGLNGTDNEFYYGYNEDYNDGGEYKVVYTISKSPTYCYTFGKDTDYSITGVDYGNVIKEYKDNNIKLNNIVFLGNNCYSNSFGDNCYSNSLGSWCHSNSFGDNCYSNSLGIRCSSNNLGDGCYSNSLDSDCDSNSFGDNCYSNSLGSDCDSNSFGDNCYSNSLGSDCRSNNLGDGCYNNSLVSSCGSNSFGDDCNNNRFDSNCHHNSFNQYISHISLDDYCYYNVFGNSCSYNRLGGDCYANSFGSDCSYNSLDDFSHYNVFGNGCSYNTFGYCESNSLSSNCSYITLDTCFSNSFGSNCQYIKFASDSSASTKYNYYRNNHFGDGCAYILFKGAETASSASQVQNYNFAQGLKGISSAYLTIDGVRNLSYETKVAKNSTGEIKTYCEADLIL